MTTIIPNTPGLCSGPNADPFAWYSDKPVELFLSADMFKPDPDLRYRVLGKVGVSQILIAEMMLRRLRVEHQAAGYVRLDGGFNTRNLMVSAAAQYYRELIKGAASSHPDLLAEAVEVITLVDNLAKGFASVVYAAKGHRVMLCTGELPVGSGEAIDHVATRIGE